MTRGQMTTKYLVAVLALAILTTGCKKNEDGSSAGAGGSLPGIGSTSVHTYKGAVSSTWPCSEPNCYQTVSVAANVLDYPHDGVQVYLCRNVNCAVAPVPTTRCSEVPTNTTAACYTSIPSSQILLGRNTVQFVNANQTSCVNGPIADPITGAFLGCVGGIVMPGYSSYYIDTTVTR